MIPPGCPTEIRQTDECYNYLN